MKKTRHAGIRFAPATVKTGEVLPKADSQTILARLSGCPLQNRLELFCLRGASTGGLQLGLQT